MLCAAGPFTTTDNLAYDPLQDLLAVVRGEKPDLLLLVSATAGNSYITQCCIAYSVVL